jgi:O-acetyl-ADP-ribose deacetylase (regulator of RNase III)
MDAPLRRIELVNHDIVAMKVDAIVNEANAELRCG